MSQRSVVIFVYLHKYKFGWIIHLLNHVKPGNTRLPCWFSCICKRRCFECIFCPRFDSDKNMNFTNLSDFESKLNTKLRENGKGKWMCRPYVDGVQPANLPQRYSAFEDIFLACTWGLYVRINRQSNFVACSMQYFNHSCHVIRRWKESTNISCCTDWISRHHFVPTRKGSTWSVKCMFHKLCACSTHSLGDHHFGCGIELNKFMKHHSN